MAVDVTQHWPLGGEAGGCGKAAAGVSAIEHFLLG